MKDAVLVQIQRIAGQYKAIQKVVLFGSRARQDHEPQSDYDIAIFAPALTGREQGLFRNELECIDTFHKIDVVFIEKRHKGSELYHHILRDGVILMDKFQIKLNNFQNAVARLHEALEEAQMNNSLTVRDGVIQRFEFTSELAWKTVREYLLTLEVSDITKSKMSPASSSAQSALSSVFAEAKTVARFLAPPLSRKVRYAGALREPYWRVPLTFFSGSAISR